MANSIALAKQYVPILDKVYKKESLTAVLDGANELVKQGANVNELLIPKIAMDGLGDYSKSLGYAVGDVNLQYETVKADFDRGRKFVVDDLDNEESQNVAFGQLSKEFIRVKVAPELDAVRISKYCGIAVTAGNYASGAISTGAAAIAAIRDGIDSFDDGEVTEEDRYLFITPTLLGLIEDLDTTKSRKVLDTFAKVIKTPQKRMYSAIDQYDGRSVGETGGGYVKDSTSGVDLNFLMVAKSAVVQFSKHVVPKVIEPKNNQDADAWIYGYRHVAVAQIYENKTAGVFAHKSTT